MTGSPTSIALAFARGACLGVLVAIANPKHDVEAWSLLVLFLLVDTAYGYETKRIKQ